MLKFALNSALDHNLFRRYVGGFAVVKEDGADVCVAEAVRVEDLDESLVSPCRAVRGCVQTRICTNS